MSKTYPGVCELCEQEMPKAQVTRHLASCTKEHDAGSAGASLVHILVEADGAPEYWLHVEGRAQASLEQLDRLLRNIWLECCGHMSAFYVQGDEVAMSSRLGSVLGTKGMSFQHEYDFGSTTALKGRVVGLRTGSMSRDSIRLLARNSPPKWKCSSCESAAKLVCGQCMHFEPSLFCKAHARKHGCAADDALLPVVNSPRMGVCGYTG